MKYITNSHTNQDFNRNYSYGSVTNQLIGFTVNSTLYENLYDPNRNLLKEVGMRYLEWDANDKLAVFKNQAGTSTPSVYTNYFYNAQGERVKKHTRKGNKVTVTFYMDGGMFETSYVKPTGGSIDNNRFYNTIKISDDGALIATTRVGNNVDDNTFAIKYIVGDHLNNSTAVLKTTGTLINREEYYPFGETSFGGFQYKRYRYNGKEKDEESGLYEYGQRYYAPWLCRFVSVDPIAESYPQLSSYNYAGNKPITHVDLDGLQSDGGDDQFVGPPTRDQACGSNICNTEIAISEIYKNLNTGGVNVEVGDKKTLNDIEFTYLGEGQWALGDTNIDLGSLYDVIKIVGDAISDKYDSIQEKAAQGKSMKDQGFALSITVDLTDFVAEGVEELMGDHAEDFMKKMNNGVSRNMGRNVKGSGNLSIKGQLSTEGKISLFFEAGSSLEVGVKKGMSVSIADASITSGIEYDFSSGEADLFTSQSFYFFGWNFENTDRFTGGNEKELNIGAKFSAAGVEVEILMAIPEPTAEMKRAEGSGYGTSYEYRRSHVLLRQDILNNKSHKWTYMSR